MPFIRGWSAEMVLVLRLISTYANWIYLFCALGVLLCLSATRSAMRERNASLFTLEREAATSRARRVLGFMVVVLLVAGATAFIDLSLVPRMNLSPQTSVRTPLPLPTATNIVPPATPTPAVGQPSPTPTRPLRPTPTPEEETPTPSPTTASPPPPSACPNPRVNITWPQGNAHVGGVVEIRGTADIENFRYYKIEFAAGENPSDADWHWIGEGRNHVEGGVLLTWNTAGLSPGIYSLRLTVVDASGNYPPPCQVQLYIE